DGNRPGWAQNHERWPSDGDDPRYTVFDIPGLVQEGSYGPASGQDVFTRRGRYLLESSFDLDEDGADPGIDFLYRPPSPYRQPRVEDLSPSDEEDMKRLQRPLESDEAWIDTVLDEVTRDAGVTKSDVRSRDRRFAKTREDFIVAVGPNAPAALVAR